MSDPKRDGDPVEEPGPSMMSSVVPTRGLLTPRPPPETRSVGRALRTMPGRCGIRTPVEKKLPPCPSVARGPVASNLRCTRPVAQDATTGSCGDRARARGRSRPPTRRTPRPSEPVATPASRRRAGRPRGRCLGRSAADLRPGARGPLPRGNRGAAGAIGLLAALAFGDPLPRGVDRHGLIDGDGRDHDIADEGAGRPRHLVALGAGRRVLHRVLAARRDHQPWSLGSLGHLRTARRCRCVPRTHPRCALPGAVLDADRKRGRRSSSRRSCCRRWRSRRSSSAAS